MCNLVNKKGNNCFERGEFGTGIILLRNGMLSNDPGRRINASQ
jgi:hypothetical protein